MDRRPWDSGGSPGRRIQRPVQAKIELHSAGGSENRETGEGTEYRDIVDALVRLAILADRSGAVHGEDDGKTGQRDIVKHLIDRPLHEGGVDRDHRPQAARCEPRRKGDGMLFRYADIVESPREGSTKALEARAFGHGGRDGHEPRVRAAALVHGFGKSLGERSGGPRLDDSVAAGHGR